MSIYWPIKHIYSYLYFLFVLFEKRKKKMWNWTWELGFNMCIRTGIKHVYQGVQGACPRQAMTHAIGMGLRFIDIDNTTEMSHVPSMYAKQLSAQRSTYLLSWLTWQRLIHRVTNPRSPPVGLTTLDGLFHWLLQNSLRAKEILQRAGPPACCWYYLPNPEVRHPPSQHRLSRWSLQHWILVVRLLWVSTLKMAYSPQSWVIIR